MSGFNQASFISRLKAVAARKLTPIAKRGPNVRAPAKAIAPAPAAASARPAITPSAPSGPATGDPEPPRGIPVPTATVSAKPTAAAAPGATVARPAAGLSPEDIESQVTRIQHNAGLVALPIGDEVARILRAAGRLNMTSRERFDSLPKPVRDRLANAEYHGMGDFGAPPLPRDAVVMRILGNYDSSLLTPLERWNLLPEQTRRMLANYQTASGHQYVPNDQVNDRASRKHTSSDPLIPN